MYLPSSPTPLTHSGTEVPSPLPIRELRSHLHYLFGHWGLISITYSGTEVPSPLSIWALRSHLHYLFGHWGPIYLTNSGTEVPSPLPIQALRSHLHYQFRQWGPIYITNSGTEVPSTLPMLFTLFSLAGGLQNAQRNACLHICTSQMQQRGLCRNFFYPSH